MNDLLIICEQAESEFEQLKPKRPLDTIGILVSSDINAFTEESTKNKLSNTSKRSGIDPAKGFSLHVPCVQKVFKFYARNAQEKKRWLSVFMNVAQANRFEDEIDRVSGLVSFFLFILFLLNYDVFSQVWVQSVRS